MNPAATRRRGGFTLVEALVAMTVLSVGLLGVAQAFYWGMRHMSTSSPALIAREKAREAIESVHTARDTLVITWSQIRNVSNGGVFLDGPQPLYNAGADGLIGTADDAASGLEVLRDPGPDGILGTADDILTPLSGYTRQIQITEMTPVNPDLRQLTVTITYQVGTQQGTYILRTYISAYS
jgi:prepilin-type N-terminal cleavage/methylation domain-containing protein